MAAMDSNSSWVVVSSFHLVSPVVWMYEPVSVISGVDVQVPITEYWERCVIRAWNSDGYVYAKDEFVTYFGTTFRLEYWQTVVCVGRADQPLPPSTPNMLPESNDDNKVFARIILPDGHKEGAIKPLFRRRVRNAKLLRPAVLWTTLVKNIALDAV